MPLFFLILLFGFPILEIMVLIEVGADIGGFSTIALCILTAMIGLHLVRLQGMRVFEDIRIKSENGEPIGKPLIHGVFLAVAGVFLFFPGFITDTVGALLLIPPVRILLGSLGLVGVFKNMRPGTTFYTHTSTSGSSGFRRHTHEETTIIEGEFVDETGGQNTDEDTVIKVIDVSNTEENKK